MEDRVICVLVDLSTTGLTLGLLMIDETWGWVSSVQWLGWA